VKARLSLALPLGLLAVVVAIAGCGGSSSGSTSSSSGGAGTAASGGGGGQATVDVANFSQFGKILVDSSGLTLYTFAKDVNGQSMCSGACAKVWPPLMASGKPTAGSEVDAGMLGTVKRSDGSTQVTYGGEPLYTYTADTAPGQATGNGIDTFGAEWNAVQPNGAKAPTGGSSGGSGSSASAGSSSSTSSSGGYGY
jgi:predicted lipoprotein with Yx(FWY)xxD motif